MTYQDFEKGATLSHLSWSHVVELLKIDDPLGRGSVVIRQACEKAGLSAPQWRSDTSGVTLTFFAPEATTEATMEATTEVARLAAVMDGSMTRAEIQQKMGLNNAEHFRKRYLLPALQQGVIVMTLPDKPSSPKQRYVLTALGGRLKFSSCGLIHLCLPVDQVTSK